jgi:hypothetical protein
MFLLRLCFPACQNHNNCDPFLLPPTSCSFNYELGGCKHVRTCPFARCLAIVACCESKVHTLISQWVCMLTHLDFFVEGVFCIFDYCWNPSCIKLGLYILIGYLLYNLLCCNHMLCWFSSFIFLPLPLLCFIVMFCCCFVKTPKYSIEVTTCDLE